jgi:4-amino-4-deoxy-L-arabinose transferase-like glycosyltransferase
LVNKSSRSRYAWATTLLLLGGTIFHLAYSTHLELVGDEAYYWLWSWRLDICYADKGPMIAWLIWLGTSFFGQTVFGVRFFAVLLAGGTGVGLYLLGRDLFSSRVGFWAVVLATVAPLFAVGASLMTIDTVYIFFWTWAAWFFWHAKDDPRLRWWLLAGITVGLGILSKYTALLELISFAAFCSWHRPSRVHFRRATFWIMLATALLFLLPAIVWNQEHHWPTGHWLWQRGGLNEQVSFHLVCLLVFLAAQAGVISPLFFLGLVFIICRPAILQRPQPATGYTLALFLPPFGLYLLLSLHYPEPPNWPAAAYIGGLVLLASKWIELTLVSRWARRATIAAVALAMIETGILLETRWLHLPPKLDPLDRARGSRNLAASVAKVQQRTGAQFVIADHYMTAALLSFYLPGQPETFVPISAHPLDQLEIWPNYEEKHPSGDGLFVTRRKVSRSFRVRFAEVKSLGEISAVADGRVIGHYHFYLCRRNLRKNSYLQPIMVSPSNR